MGNSSKKQLPAEGCGRFLLGHLEFFDSPEMLRTVAKTAYTALALRMGADFAMRDTFNDVREFVRTGKGTTSAKLFFLNEDFLCRLRSRDHINTRLFSWQEK